MPKYCPKCGHSFPEDWDECNECEVELVYEEKDRIIELSDIDKKYYDYKSRVYMDEECSQREIKHEANLPKCPICGSTDLKKLTAVDRSASAFMWGLGSNKIGKTYECRKCKATF
jgi:hypothetical protein